MSQARTTKQIALALVAAAALAACGGGGDPTPFTVATTASGVWKGSTDGNRATTAIILDDGSYYVVYSSPTNAASVAGGVQGTGALAGTSFTSANGRNYNFEGAGVQTATLAATLQPFSSLVGTVTNATSGGFGFQSAYSADSRDTASLATLAGAYPGQVTFIGGVRNSVFTVTAAGAVSTAIDGCIITGSTAPRSDVNAYDVTITFGGAPCVPQFQNTSFTGVAYLDTATGALTSFVRNPTVLGGQAIFFRGAKS
jgi:hypothetical protein